MGRWAWPGGWRDSGCTWVCEWLVWRRLRHRLVCGLVRAFGVPPDRARSSFAGRRRAREGVGVRVRWRMRTCLGRRGVHWFLVQRPSAHSASVTSESFWSVGVACCRAISFETNILIHRRGIGRRVRWRGPIEPKWSLAVMVGWLSPRWVKVIYTYPRAWEHWSTGVVLFTSR